MKDILLVEDHAELNHLMQMFLEKDGFTVKGVFSGEEALAYLETEKVKMIILDVVLPGMDGFAVCADVRARSNIPVLFLSARGDKEDKMNGFLQGADDYIEKPIDMDILSARVRALMRRSYDLKRQNMVIRSGDISIDKEARQVFLAGRELTLTGKEYELLVLLVENPGRVLKKEYLFSKI